MAVKIRLRRVAISGNIESLYFDYYPPLRNPETMKVTRSKSLGMYLFQDPKNELERQYNKEILLKAEIIRCKQIESLINEEFNFYDSKKMNSDFLAYFHSIANKKSRSWMVAYFHFQKFMNDKCTFNDLSIIFQNFKCDFL